MEYLADRSEEMTELESSNMNRVRNLASECAVLLENDGTLPIASPCSVALYGTGARYTVKGGTGSGDVNSRFEVSIEEGLEAAGVVITTKGWLDRYDEAKNKHFEEYTAMVEKYAEDNGIVLSNAYFNFPYRLPDPVNVTPEDIAASATDMAIMVITRNSGEGADRKNEEGDYKLSGEEINMLEVLRASYPKLIVLLNVGGVIDTTELKDCGVNSLLLISQTGNITGHIAADLVVGKTVPSGKLTSTWAGDYDKYPTSATFNTDRHEEFYLEGLYVGYRYFDSFGVEPDYPFGFGRSYTTFDVSVADVICEGSRIKAVVNVTNTGDRFPGKEVIQIYCSAPGTRIDRPYQELICFAKTGLIMPGDTEQVTLFFKASDLACYDEESFCNVICEGDYYIRIGTSSRDTKIEAVVNIPADIKTRVMRDILNDDRDIDLTPVTNPGYGDQVNELKDSQELLTARQLAVDPRYVRCEKILYNGVRDTYDNYREIDTVTLTDVMAHSAGMIELVGDMSDTELATLCVGNFDRGDIDEDSVWAASKTVPGAAAESADCFYRKRRIPPMVLADGPAGLRLQPHFKTTPDGQLLPGGEIFNLARTPFPEDTPEDAIDYYQYCTAIPVATAIAQSWNETLAQSLGDIVGYECEKYGVNLWLAPGMNIHRDPLCGRNFEYFSEDPLLTGKMAAGETRGVQNHSGVAVTIKHFCCNNRETNRMFNNSHVPVRALRDIYLKGFEICVDEAKPLAVMTSYNLLNGVHTAANYELIQNVLRDEFGFEGVVMTDWFSSFPVEDMRNMGEGLDAIYPEAVSHMCVYAGCDWQMPGCQANIDDIVHSVAQGRLSRGDLQNCALNIIRFMLKIME
ncbi:MAG: glycoside hydrolase family 3 protein [Clostridiales bacterium]|nr:glycoside hydrolase family 3 protein [Clostridiales bacterium]